MQVGNSTIWLIQRNDSIKPTLDFLNMRRSQLQSLTQKSNNVEQVVNKIAKKICEFHLCVIVALHDTGVLPKLLNICLKKNQEARSIDLQSNVKVLYSYGYDYFLCKYPYYVKVMDYFKSKGKYLQNRGFIDLQGKQLQRQQKIRGLLLSLFALRESNEESFDKYKKLNELVVNVLPGMDALNGFEECMMTWVRKEVEEIQGELHKKINFQNINLCCRLHFQEKEVVANPGSNQAFFTNGQFLKYKVGNGFREALKRWIISYLNGFGGIIYFGMDSDIKKCTVTGVSMGKAEREQFLRFVFEVVTKIYPNEFKTSQIPRQIQNKKQYFQKQLSDVKFEYILSRYISLDFINVYSKSESVYLRDAITKQNILYVVRLRVRAGDEYQLYHHINEKETPEAYFRDDKKQKKLSFSQFYDEMYRRLKLKVNGRKNEKGKSPIHDLCRAFRAIELPAAGVVSK